MTDIFMNLPVKNLDRSMDFFAALGFDFNPKFTNEHGACMVIAENIYAMLLTEPMFKGFTPKEIADATKTTEVMTALSCESRKAVDAFLEKAIEAGATETRDPQDHGFMYGRAFNDPDGHIWEMFWMDPAHVQT
jgi:uncharacterized protein